MVGAGQLVEQPNFAEFGQRLVQPFAAVVTSLTSTSESVGLEMLALRSSGRFVLFSSSNAGDHRCLKGLGKPRLFGCRSGGGRKQLQVEGIATRLRENIHCFYPLRRPGATASTNPRVFSLGEEVSL